MKGILLLSHGRMAEGLADSATLFFGDDIPQLDYLCLMQSDNPDNFGLRIKEKVDELDKGDGVVILADLFGGTPFNQSVALLGDDVDIISGMNFPMFVQLLFDRVGGNVDISTLIQAGKDGITDVKQVLG